MPNRVLIICSDLFFSTQLRAGVESAGAEAVVEMQAGRAPQRLSDSRFGHVIVDLETPALDLPGLLEALPEETRPVVIAFGPHVHEQRLQAARDAGCDIVASRGQIATSIPRLLQNHHT